MVSAMSTADPVVPEVTVKPDSLISPLMVTSLERVCPLLSSLIRIVLPVALRAFPAVAVIDPPFRVIEALLTLFGNDPCV